MWVARTRSAGGALTPDDRTWLQKYVEHMQSVKPEWVIPEHIERALSGKVRKKRRRSDPCPSEVRQAVLERDGHKCFFCKATTDLQVHHMEHRAKGGKHDMENLLTVCEEHHAWLHEGEHVHAIMKKRIEDKKRTA